MKRFVKSFYEFSLSEIIDKINKYAERYDLEIITLSASNDLHGAIVLFESKKPLNMYGN